MVHKDTSLPSSQAAGFLNRATIPCPNNLSLDLLTYYMAKQYEQPVLLLVASQLWLGDFGGKALAAARTTRPEDLPLKIP